MTQTQPLVIDYVLESRRPGYTFTTPTDGLPEDIVQAVWRSAMPRGQGWRDFTGARALKSFPVDGGRLAAFSEVEVLDREDESGRRGIRRATVTLLDSSEHRAALQVRLAAMPESVQAAAAAKLSCPRWMRIVERALPRLTAGKGQVILAAPYTTPADWDLMTALVIRVALALPMRAVKGFPAVLPLTTLALERRDEAPLIAMPLAVARERSDGVPIIEIG